MIRLPRNPWPLAIIGYFACAIAFLSCFIAWSLRQREDLVSSDYYEREVRYQSHLDAVQRSLSLSSNNVVSIDPATQAVIVRVPAGVSQDGVGRVHFYRPSDARLDWEAPLNLDAQGTQAFGLQRLRDGLWKVRVHWRAHGQDYYFDQTVVIGSDLTTANYSGITKFVAVRVSEPPHPKGARETEPFVAGSTRL
jgi:nitrogen fixation protein FixH